MEKKVKNLYENYQKIILEAALDESLIGEILDPDIVVHAVNASCGDRLKISLRVKNNIVTEIKYIGESCILSRGSSAILLKYLNSKPLQAITDLDFYSIMPIERLSKRGDCFELAFKECLRILPHSFPKK